MFIVHSSENLPPWQKQENSTVVQQALLVVAAVPSETGVYLQVTPVLHIWGYMIG